MWYQYSPNIQAYNKYMHMCMLTLINLSSLVDWVVLIVQGHQVTLTPLGPEVLVVQDYSERRELHTLHTVYTDSTREL